MDSRHINKVAGNIVKSSFSKGFFISLLFVLLFFLPINYYYSRMPTAAVSLPDFTWTSYESFYPSLIFSNEGTVLYDEINPESYPEWEQKTRCALTPTVYSEGCFEYKYDSFGKKRLEIHSEADARLVLNRKGNITETTGRQFAVDLTAGDKIFFYAPPGCVPYVLLSDASNVYSLRLGRAG